MPRPRNCRNIKGPPLISAFKPVGTPARCLKSVTISLDEFEAIRLADHEGLEHEEASKLLGISRSVFTRLVEKARQKIADALINGCAIIIEGGDYHFQCDYYRCLKCFAVIERSFSENPPVNCPNCGSEDIKHLNEHYGGRGHCRRHGGNI